MAVTEVIVKSALGENLRRARRAADLTQQQAADKLGVTKQTISDQERGVSTPPEKSLGALAELYGTTPAELRYGTPPATLLREPEASYLRSEFTPNPALRKRLRPGPYARVYQHIEQMVAAGCAIDQIEEAERLMIDGAYNKLNKRDARERTDAEMIMDIDAAWLFIKEVLEREGIRGLK